MSIMPYGARQVLHLAMLSLLCVLVFAVPMKAAPLKAIALSPQDRADVQRIEQYLNGIHTLSAHFQQYAADGGNADGILYLSRPGRMRFEYAAPSPVLLLADGSFVVYIDNHLKQVTQLPINSTPAWFLLRDKVSLDDGVTITRFDRGADVLRVTLVQTKSPEDGSLTLTFGDRPFELKQWTVVDQQGKTTTVALSDPKFGVSLDPKLFTFQDPRTDKGGSIKRHESN